MGYIKEEDILKNKITISKKVIHLDKYDMYYVNIPIKDGSTRIVRTFCEKGTFPDFESEEFAKLQRNYGKELVTYFMDRLIGEKGLLAKEGRDDYIYLGADFLQDGHIANRFSMQANGKSGQQNFDDNLFKIKMQVEAKENDDNNAKTMDNVTGKNYVIADIHGMYGTYLDVIRKLKNNDHLYIIGDVIDRGSEGINILQDIMRRKQDKDNNPDITFLLGNHEMQFIHTIAIMLKHGLHAEDLNNIIKRKKYQLNMGEAELDKDKKSKTQNKRKFEKYDKIIKEKGLRNWEADVIGIWIVINKGYSTISEFLNLGANKDGKKQEDIYRFLLNSYVVLPQNINGKNYLFVHSMPPRDLDMIKNMKQNGRGYKITELTPQQYEFMLQERDKSTYEQANKEGFITICGHTPDLGTITKDDEKGFIRIDSGCGHKQRQSKLALYCIEDNSVQFFDEKENEQETKTL